VPFSSAFFFFVFLLPSFSSSSSALLPLPLRCWMFSICYNCFSRVFRFCSSLACSARITLLPVGFPQTYASMLEQWQCATDQRMIMPKKKKTPAFFFGFFPFPNSSKHKKA
jgi:hypothetical protein